MRYSLVFSSPKIAPINPDPQNDPKFRVLQLNIPTPTSTSTSSSNPNSEIPPSLQSFLETSNPTSNYSLIPHPIKIDFSYFNTDQILHSILPLSLLETSDGVPTSFTTTGHIAHLNLRTPFLPYKYLIGDLILIKNSSIRTVVNKLDSIDNVYRFFQMELISGEPEFLTKVNEGEVQFEFDFRKVYWNSRLSTEHRRLVESIEPNEVLIDVMAGVGPFSLPASKNGTWCFSNDLNPDSFESLRGNSERNGKIVKERMVGLYNIDGREFIKSSPKLCWERKCKGERIGMGKVESWEMDVREEKEKSLNERKRRLELGKKRKLEKENGIEKTVGNIQLNGNGNHQDQQTNQSNSTNQTSSNSTLQSQASTSTTSTTSKESELPRNLSLLPDHYILNLPDSALTFLDCFRGSWLELRDSVGSEILEKELKRRKESYGYEFPLVHVHCFTKETESQESSWRDVCEVSLL